MWRPSSWSRFPLSATLLVCCLACTNQPASQPTTSTDQPPNTIEPAASEVPPPVDAESIAVVEVPTTQKTAAVTDTPEVIADQIVELLESAKFKSHTDDDVGADRDYQQAGRLAEGLLKPSSELTRQQLRIVAVASYFQARQLAKTAEPRLAFPAIERAVEAGFEDLERLETDAEFATVRALTDFGPFRERLSEGLAAKTQAAILKQLGEFKPYPLQFRLPDLDGNEISLDDFRGKVVVLAFWGTWCVKCQAEVPALNRLQKSFGERGVRVIGLSYEEIEDNSAAVERIRTFLESHPIEYLCLLGDETVRDQVEPPEDAPPEWVFPVTLILDPQGQVRLHFTGEVSYRKLEAAVIALLNQDAK